MSEKKMWLGIILALLVCILEPMFIGKEYEEETHPIDYLYEIDDVDSSLKSEYGMTPEDALEILECYLLEDEEDYYPIPKEDLVNAYSVMYDYYYDTKDIAYHGIVELSHNES